MSASGVGPFSDLTLRTRGHQFCTPGHFFGPATLEYFLFHYVISGKGELHATNSKGTTHVYHITPGQGFMTWPGQGNYYKADKKDPWEYMWLAFNGLLATEMVLQSGLDVNQPIYVPQSPEENEQMLASMRYIIQNPNQPNTKLMGHLYLFLSSLIQSSDKRIEKTAGNLQRFYIRKAVGYIGLNYAKNITVQDIAEHCSIHRGYLSAIFKELLSNTPQQYLAEYRVNKACELLKSTRYMVTEIGKMVGYPNQVSFSRAFKRALGVSPHRWRIGHMPQ